MHCGSILFTFCCRSVHSFTRLFFKLIIVSSLSPQISKQTLNFIFWTISQSRLFCHSKWKHWVHCTNCGWHKFYLRFGDTETMLEKRPVDEVNVRSRSVYSNPRASLALTPDTRRSISRKSRQLFETKQQRVDVACCRTRDQLTFKPVTELHWVDWNERWLLFALNNEFALLRTKRKQQRKHMLWARASAVNELVGNFLRFEGKWQRLLFRKRQCVLSWFWAIFKIAL